MGGIRAGLPCGAQASLPPLPNLFKVKGDTLLPVYGHFRYRLRTKVYPKMPSPFSSEYGISTVFENLEDFPKDWKTNAPAFASSFVRRYHHCPELSGIWRVSFLTSADEIKKALKLKAAFSEHARPDASNSPRGAIAAPEATSVVTFPARARMQRRKLCLTHRGKATGRSPRPWRSQKGDFFKDEVEQGRYGPIFPKTPACYGFSIIAKIIPGREEHSSMSMPRTSRKPWRISPTISPCSSCITCDGCSST